MSGCVQAILAATAFCALLLVAPNGAQALTAGAKTQPPVEALTLARRECNAGYYDKNGKFVCTNWVDCKPGDTVC